MLDNDGDFLWSLLLGGVEVENSSVGSSRDGNMSSQFMGILSVDGDVDGAWRNAEAIF